MALLRAARKDEIPAGSIREFQVDGKTLAVSNVAGSFTPLTTLACIAADRWGRVSLRARS